MPAFEQLTIDTPEQIALEFPLATAGSRFLAIAIDTLIQIGVFLALALLAVVGSFVSIAADSRLGLWVLALLLIVAFLLYYGYYAFFEALWNGQTPGKRAIRLRVIAASGRPITVYQALLRNLIRIVDQLPGMYAVGLTSMFLTERHQRLGDLAADTVVVTEQPITRQEMPQPASVRTVRRGAARLTPEELQLVETFLQRRRDLADEVRSTAARTIAARVRRQLHLPERDSVDDEVLLEEVAAEARSGWR